MPDKSQVKTEVAETVTVDVRGVPLEGYLRIPQDAAGIVLFAHGSGSSRHSTRNRAVAAALEERGLATLLFDLLSAEEEAVDRVTRHLRFDIPLLAERVIGTIDWLQAQEETRDLSIGCFGASTGAAAALMAAAARPQAVAAVVSRGGRPDLAHPALSEVEAPTLLIVGGDDVVVLGMNERALAQLNTEKKLEVVPDATHLFVEPGALEEVARLAGDWFLDHLPAD